MHSVIRVGSRKSLLAMRQTEIVVEKLKNAFPQTEFKIIGISTKGDEVLNKALSTIGGKGLFTKELEVALLTDTIDMAVHSAKDMPSELPEGLCIGAYLEREDSRDVLVTTSGKSIYDMPKGTIIGTGSLRREIQIKQFNKEVEVKLIRGNIHTRIDKLKSGEYDGIILAMAGLSRMGLLCDKSLSFEVFESDKFLSAAGQGILTVETRCGDLGEYMSAINCKEAEYTLNAERAFLSEIGGSCNAPIGAFAKLEQDMINMQTLYAKEDKVVRLSSRDKIENATALGKELAEKTLQFLKGQEKNI